MIKTGDLIHLDLHQSTLQTLEKNLVIWTQSHKNTLDVGTYISDLTPLRFTKLLSNPVGAEIPLAAKFFSVESPLAPMFLLLGRYTAASLPEQFTKPEKIGRGIPGLSVEPHTISMLGDSLPPQIPLKSRQRRRCQPYSF